MFISNTDEKKIPYPYTTGSRSRTSLHLTFAMLEIFLYGKVLSS
jgi:hypothetical protein